MDEYIEPYIMNNNILTSINTLNPRIALYKFEASAPKGNHNSNFVREGMTQLKSDDEGLDIHK